MNKTRKLKLEKSTLRTLGRGEVQYVVGGLSGRDECTNGSRRVCDETSVIDCGGSAQCGLTTVH